MPENRKRPREEVREKPGKKQRKKAKLMSDDHILAASKADLKKYNDDNPGIFEEVDFSTSIHRIRAEFIKQQALFEVRKYDGSSDEDEEGDSDGDDEDEVDGDSDGDESVEEDEDEDSDDEDSDSDEDRTTTQRKKKQPLEKKAAKKKSPKKLPTKNKTKILPPSTPKKSPPRSIGITPKSPTVASPSAVSALLRPRVDLERVAKSAQCLGERFVRGGNEHLKPSQSRSLRRNDLVAIPNADFSAATTKHKFTEEILFCSYYVYFYVVTAIERTAITLQYEGRIEPLEKNPPAEFTRPLHLDQLSRDSIKLPLDQHGNWVIATTKGHPLFQALFPSNARDRSGNGKSNGGGSSGSKDNGSRSSSGSGSSSSSGGSSSSSRSSGSSRSSTSHGSCSSRSSGRGSDSNTGNSVTFSPNDNIIMATGVDGVAELPFVGTTTPPMTAAIDTLYWRPLGSGKSVSSHHSNPTNHQPLVCNWSSSEFYLVNVNRQDTKESTVAEEKKEETVLARRLVNPHHVTTHFTGKGLEVKPLEDVIRYFANQSISVRNDKEAHGPSVSSGWNQIMFDVAVFNQISTCKVYRSASLYGTYYKFGLFKSTSNPNELDSSSPRLTDFIAASLSFDPDQKVTSDNDNSGQKVILGAAIHQVELVLSLSRHPAVFLHAFEPIVTALSDPTHEVGKDLYTVAALTWHFEISLAEFFRRIRYHKGQSDVLVFRRLLWSVVVSPFVNLTPQVPICYSLANQTRQLQKMAAVHRKEAPALQTPPPTQSRTAIADTTMSNVSAAITTATSTKSSVPTNRKFCKYHFASYLKVPFPGAENKIPECTFKNDPAKCPACPHQDFSTWAKKDLQALLTSAKGDFKNASSAWSSIYNGMMTAIDGLA